MISFFTSNLLWSEGFYILVWLIIASLMSFIFYRPLFYAGLLFIVFSLYFFRNPERRCIAALSDASVLVCPADGTVVDIQYNAANNLDGYAQKVSIFLSPFDVHVNWTPMAGVIQDVVYRPGTFSMAFLPKSSELNERNDIIIRDNGKKITVRQIAGTIARRICCWVIPGQDVPLGYKYGMIRFGSRVDILLPDNVTLAVGVGQKVCGGHTVLGRWQ